MPQDNPFENKDFVTIEEFRDVTLKLERYTNLQKNLQISQSALIKEVEKLSSMVTYLKKENQALKFQSKEIHQTIEAILGKFNLEIKKTSKVSKKFLGLHDDYTERCSKCKSITNRKDKSCSHCGINKK